MINKLILKSFASLKLINNEHIFDYKEGRKFVIYNFKSLCFTLAVYIVDRYLKRIKTGQFLPKTF